MFNFTFHGIGEPPPAIGDAERGVWMPRADFLSALDAIRGVDRARVAFGDGDSSDLRIALPALFERGMSADFFIVVERIGAPGYLDAGDLRALREAGIRIGSHGVRYRAWRGLSHAGLREEIVEARDQREAAVKAPVTSAACPFGTEDRRSLRALRNTGFMRVFSSDGGDASPRAWLQPRNTLARGNRGSAVSRIVEDAAGMSAALRHAKTLAKRCL